ncbi:conserved hypothetical protein [Candidatus Desulfarcum epimagneticum]|uniref:Polymerase nucleotidyl transferase domain-containing protein n=1 Tax=uncultured Desulfobacteraceae bacterium TaxID=218296 RepID=A0A484HEF4_9BACT|nr:conserved hypothetical protein [uncultured Desulfobacteraceae bacterium]
MVEKSVIASVKNYLKELEKIGSPAQFGVLFGSFAQNAQDQWSDIDLMVISPVYDEEYGREEVNILWRAAARVDSRIEPVPIGSKRWMTDDESPIIEAARRQGVRIDP